MPDKQLSSPRFNSNMMHRINHIYLVGIGGAGMSGIAEVLLNLGYKVSGSDMATNATTKRLEENGAKIYNCHAIENIKCVDVLVVSTAIDDDNPELVEARTKRIPIVSRAEMLAELMRFRQGIAVAGTHGKTTTTSLVASVLAAGGLDPTFVIGGKLNSVSSHGQLGSGEYLVAEADESDASFLYLQPMIVVLTNIDADHLATYDNNFENLKNTFIEFLHHTPFYGIIVMCIDDPVVREISSKVKRPFITYGFSKDADIRVLDLEQQQCRTRFRVKKDKLSEINIELNMPGRHNALNATAAIAVAIELGIDINDIKKSLSQFQGIARRFQINGDVPLNNGTVSFIDDYAHHPKEIQSTIEAIRQGWPNQRLVVSFQPHRYSRTQDLFDDFCAVLADVDVLCISEVYPAGEVPIVGADGRSLCAGVRARGKVNPVFVEDINELPVVLKDLLKEGDISLTVGAGNIGSIALQLPGCLKNT